MQYRRCRRIHITVDDLENRSRNDDNGQEEDSSCEGAALEFLIKDNSDEQGKDEDQRSFPQSFGKS